MAPDRTESSTRFTNRGSGQEAQARGARPQAATRAPTRRRSRGPLIPVDELSGLDARRRHTREMIQQLVERAAHLPEADAALIRAVYAEGRSVSSLAKMLGRDPRWLRRRVRGLVKRIASPEYIFVATRRAHWAKTRARVAALCILEGRSLREAASELGLTLHTVRRHHDAVRELCTQHRNELFLNVRSA